MLTTVYFVSDRYGNYQDGYYTDSYETLIDNLVERSAFHREVNLGFTDGVVIMNKFNGDFTQVNCAVVVHETQGTHIYKIIKKEFILKDVWNITMVKDLVSSKYQNILDSKVLVSRLGIPRNVINPLLFVNEQMQLSEIKTSQTLLQEFQPKTYGYVLIWARDSLDGTITWTGTASPTYHLDMTVTSVTTLPFYDKKYLQTTSSKNIYLGCQLGTAVANRLNVKLNEVTGNVALNVVTGYNYIKNSGTSQSSSVITPHVTLLNQSGVYPTWSSCITRAAQILYSKANIALYEENYNQYDGKVIYETSTGKYYEATISNVTREYVGDVLTNYEVATILGIEQSDLDITSGYGVYSGYIDYVIYELNLLPYSEQPTTHTFATYENCLDQPFQMMFIPYLDGVLMSSDDWDAYGNRYVTESMIYDLISKYGGDNGKLLDVQMVPFVPIDGFENAFAGDYSEFYVSETGVKDCILVGNQYDVSVWQINYSSFQRSLQYSISFDDYKVEQKRKYLLTSPSGATVYEFSVAKNGGLTGFNIAVDLRPFASFYRIQPIYANMYGGNYNDTRGLIWQEDSSLTQISSAWETYKRQNVNYLNSFNSQQSYKTSNLALTHEANWGNYGFDASKRLVEAGVEATTYAMDAVAKDVWAGAKGAASGAVGATAIMVGAVASEGIEAGQLAYNNRMDSKILENEISYSRQQFNYQLDNIRALPENLEKVSGIYQTNNFIPYIQKFEPSDSEIEYFSSYLDTYGCNIGMQVNLRNETFDYLQGTLLQYSTVITNEEYTELCSQLSRGVRKYVY